MGRSARSAHATAEFVVDSISPSPISARRVEYCSSTRFHSCCASGEQSGALGPQPTGISCAVLTSDSLLFLSHVIAPPDLVGQWRSTDSAALAAAASFVSVECFLSGADLGRDRAAEEARQPLRGPGSFGRLKVFFWFMLAFGGGRNVLHHVNIFQILGSHPAADTVTVPSSSSSIQSAPSPLLHQQWRQNRQVCFHRRAARRREGGLLIKRIPLLSMIFLFSSSDESNIKLERDRSNNAIFVAVLIFNILDIAHRAPGGVVRISSRTALSQTDIRLSAILEALLKLPLHPLRRPRRCHRR